MTKITKTKFKNALKGSGAILTQVAKKLDCARITVYDFISKNEEYCRPLIWQEEETLGDFAETALISKIKDKDSGSIKWYLATKHKKRGYVERTEIVNTGRIEISQEERSKAKTRIEKLIKDEDNS